MTTRTSAAGIAAIRQREGCVLDAYRDRVGVVTIGVGHTGRASAPTPKMGDRITLAQADAYLAADLAPFEAAVADAVPGLTQNQFDACVSLAFNIGAASFRSSSVVRHARAGDMAAAADAFLMWDKAGGKVLSGLIRRRQAERAQFLASAPAAPPVTSPGPVALPRIDVAQPAQPQGWRAWLLSLLRRAA